MNKYFTNERGLTLVELLATILLTVMISILVFGILVKGISHYKVISTDTAFRDQADYLMSNLVRELYTAKESKITKTEDPNILLIDKSKEGESIPPKKTGFENQRLYIQGEPIEPTDPSIRISTASSIRTNPVLTTHDEITYIVTLVLEMPLKNQTMTFENEIKIINDLIDQRRGYDES